MRLEPFTVADAALIEAMECDPALMTWLGGPTPLEKIPGIVARRARSFEKGDWYFKIVTDEGDAGTIGLWATEWKGAPAHETGWMLLPAYQGRGLAVAAGRALIARARAERKARVIHALPAVANAASNAICRKLGFTLAGTAEAGYNGATFPCHDWVIELW
ncbi:MAG: GNAT family N-acetyltransferase [Elusimicrobia bacterium]|nr:GNAT family N-acetyltransferase [Elusimicrobiota bacterium]